MNKQSIQKTIYSKLTIDNSCIRNQVVNKKIKGKIVTRNKRTNKRNKI